MLSYQPDDISCYSKLLQVMKPEYPKTNHQGYSIISFDINEDASISDVKVEKSMCVDSLDDQGEIKFESCPFFIPVSIAASKYLKYKKPINKYGNSCKMKEYFKYNFSIYKVDIVNNNFLLRREKESNNLERFFNEYNSEPKTNSKKFNQETSYK